MQPQEQAHGPELPKPTQENLPPVSAAEYVGAPSSTPANGTPPPMPLPAVDDNQAQPANPPQQQTAPVSGMSAQDVDLIEKEWVLRAKSIVHQTLGDPYRQSKELNKVRADYIQKRYNKTIKLSEE